MTISLKEILTDSERLAGAGASAVNVDAAVRVLAGSSDWGGGEYKIPGWHTRMVVCEILGAALGRKVRP